MAPIDHICKTMEDVSAADEEMVWSVYMHSGTDCMT